MQTDDPKSRSSSYRKYLRYSQVGVQFFAAVGLCIWGGIWLDGKLGTKVLFTLLGLAIGFAAGTYSIYVDLYGRKSRRGPQKTDGGGGEVGGGEPAKKDPSSAER